VYKATKSVQQVQREVIYLEPDAIVVYDRVKTTGGSQVWQLVSPAAPSSSESHSTLSVAVDMDRGSTVAHALQVERVSVPAGTAATSYDFAANDKDFLAGFRLDETAAAGDNRFLHVIWIDGAVTGSVTPITNGATLTLASGKTVVATFNHDAVGATLTISGQSTTLGAGVETLPELE
jgi:hypothetical protein